MTDLGRLAHRPSPWYTTAQASSYDRASKDPATNWFANGDAGQFIRVETREGRKEYVMAELKGPGAVVRIWSANPAGVARFYFDGETVARFEAKLTDLLGGKTEPFLDPLAYVSSRGWNLYFPFPYSRSLKVTLDDSEGDRVKSVYYHVGYRTYAPGTMVTTFKQPDLLPLLSEIEQVRGQLENPATTVVAGCLVPASPPPPEGTASPTPARDIRRLQPAITHTEVITGRNPTLVSLKGPAEVTQFEIEISPRTPVGKNSVDEWRLYRTLILEAWFDGEKCIEVPIGDFFGSAPGLNEYKTYPFEVSGNKMTCRFVMPFARSATFKVRNLGSQPAIVTCRAVSRPIVFDKNTYHFKAQWGGQAKSTRPMHDMTVLAATGEGTFVGMNLFVENPVDAWWGEGDEKIYINGETFPSTFGTGTEDYFGYAWCCPEVFQRPYNAQPRCDGQALGTNRGHTLVERWHILDSMPFSKSFKFDMECWHWADTPCTFTYTAYWYARPGGAALKPFDAKLLLPRPVPGKEPVAGAIEGETLKIVSKAGGTTEVQGFGELSGGKQLWWRNAEPGDKLTLAVPVKIAGRYKVIGNFCQARDYGIQSLTLNGQPCAAGPIDFYADGLAWKLRELGTFDLPSGEATLEIEVTGSNPKAVPSHMFGLDYLLLKAS